MRKKRYCVLVRENKSESDFLSYITRIPLFRFGIKHTRWCISKHRMAIFNSEYKANKAIRYIKERCVDDDFFIFEIKAFTNDYVEVCGMFGKESFF